MPTQLSKITVATSLFQLGDETKNLPGLMSILFTNLIIEYWFWSIYINNNRRKKKQTLNGKH